MEVWFKNSAGGILSGRLEGVEPESGSRPVVIFAHGFGSGKDSPRGQAVADALLERGLATLLFDFTGHGASTGTKKDSTIERQVDDLRSAINWLENESGLKAGEIAVTGASSGGLVALLTALEDDRIQAVALRGPRTDGLELRAPDFDVPILIVQGRLDPLLPETQVFYDALECRKKLVVIDGADHLFSRPEYLDDVGEITAQWFIERFFWDKKEAA